ncbi:type III restriction-modification system methylase [Mesomycoplasma flocculare ATCC 27716]|nr:type III restriction-modification system methylase [Mesomycoplasma flocculare ATCC 27716]
MNERLKLAKDLLKDDGIIFVSIDDAEQAYLKVLMDEIFGEENFVANLVWMKKTGPSGNTSSQYLIDTITEYILCYAKNKTKKVFNYLKHDSDSFTKSGFILKDEYFEQRGYYRLVDLHRGSSASSFQYLESLDYEIKAPDGSFFKLYTNIKKPKSARYTWSYKTYLAGKKQGFIQVIKNNEGFWVAKRKQYQFVKFNPKTLLVETETAGRRFNNVIDKNYNRLKNGFYTTKSANEITEVFFDKTVFNFAKPIELIKYLINICSDKKNTRILDFFAGSGTTGQAVLELNSQDGGTRSFTLITNNQNQIAQNVTYERLFRINHGFSTKKEQNFDWIKKNQPYRSNLDVFWIKHFNTKVFKKQNDINLLIEKLEKMLTNFGISSKNNINLIEYLNYLLALLPQKKDKK